MPRRYIPLIEGEYYHVFNRGVEKRTIFTDKRSYKRFIDTLFYYSYVKPPMRFSNFVKLSIEKRLEFLDSLLNEPRHISICCYVLMPNHFHLLIRQEMNGNISTFIKTLSISYTRYFNTRIKRIGPLFQGQFKAIRVESEDQLTHVSRYIHLNPYTSYIVSTLEELQAYSWSSLPAYLTKINQSLNCDFKPVLSNFKNIESYWQFIKDHADYQRKLDNIKHLLAENPDMRS